MFAGKAPKAETAAVIPISPPGGNFP